MSKGKKVSKRPAEYGTAVAGLTASITLFLTNRDVGALVVATVAFLPAIITGLVEKYAVIKKKLAEMGRSR